MLIDNQSNTSSENFSDTEKSVLAVILAEWDVFNLADITDVDPQIILSLRKKLGLLPPEEL